MLTAYDEVGASVRLAPVTEPGLAWTAILWIGALADEPLAKPLSARGSGDTGGGRPEHLWTILAHRTHQRRGPLSRKTVP